MIMSRKPLTFPKLKMSEIPLSSLSSSMMGSVGTKRTLSSIHDATVHTGGEGLKNSFLFNTKGSGSAIWTGIGVTKTKPTSTLFVTNIPGDIDMDKVRDLFIKCHGYFSFRPVRRLAFVDFESVQQATEAMRTCQGYVFAGVTKSEIGILIDFDKDPTSKRDSQYKKQVRQDERDENIAMTTIYCRMCGNSAIQIRFPDDGSITWAQLPRERAAIKLELTVFQCILKMDKGDVKAVRRVKSELIEKQYRLKCHHCNLFMAFVMQPFEKLSELVGPIYFVDTACSITPASLVDEATTTTGAIEVLDRDHVPLLARLQAEQAASKPAITTTTSVSSASVYGAPPPSFSEKATAVAAAVRLAQASTATIPVVKKTLFEPKGIISPSPLYQHTSDSAPVYAASGAYGSGLLSVLGRGAGVFPRPRVPMATPPPPAHIVTSDVSSEYVDGTGHA